MEGMRVHLIIEGRVQGVFFRETTRKKARALGVGGWVRNRRDGTVEALIEGPEERVRKLVDWCHEGPPAARVDRVQKTPEDYQDEFSYFEVTF